MAHSNIPPLLASRISRPSSPVPHLRIPHPLSRIPYPASRISASASRIPHPASRIPHPAFRIPHLPSRYPIPTAHLIYNSPMSASFEERLHRYARLVILGGINIQPGQELLIGADIAEAPFVRLL